MNGIISRCDETVFLIPRPGGPPLLKPLPHLRIDVHSGIKKGREELKTRTSGKRIRIDKAFDGGKNGRWPGR
jgi:hypothetical protein